MRCPGECAYPLDVGDVLSDAIVLALSGVATALIIWWDLWH
jgi:hypothetical protein